MTRLRLVAAFVALTCLPAFAAAAAGETFQGGFSILWNDPRDPADRSEIRYFLEVANRQYLEVLANADVNSLLPLAGRQVLVSGRMASRAATVGGSGGQVILADSIVADPSAQAARAPNVAIGTKKVLYVLTQFSDDAVVPHVPSFYTDLTIPDTSINAQIPSTINGFFDKNSGNAFSWIPTIANNAWVPLPHPKAYYAPCTSGGCFSPGAGYISDAIAALGAGFDITPYDNINFVTSNDLDCCASGGISTINGKAYGTTFEPPWGQNTQTYVHEMGHSLGLPHSGWMYFAYDSPWDTMSSSWFASSIACGSYFSRNLNAARTLTCYEPGDGYIMAHRDVLGWIPAPNQIAVPAGGSGSGALEGGALPIGGALKMIKICIPGYSCTGTGATTRYFTVEARVKGLGTTSQFDNGIAADGVIIHDVWFGRPAISGPCFLNNQSGWAIPVDATPGDYEFATCGYTQGVQLENAEFLPGMTYANDTFGFIVRVISRVGNSFNVTVDPLAGDFDGDARADMTIYKSDGTWRFLKSTSSYTAATTLGLGGAGYVPVSGDFDGDGRIDPAVYNTTTGQWIALKSSTSYSTVFSQNWGGAGYLPVPGDYDGDGKTDPAIYVPSTGQWLILKSSSGYAATLNISWGGAGYTAVPGKDFDGDGRSDIAIYNESTGFWYILKSSTAFTVAMNVSWGGHGYTLVPGDYDGDGKADPALYERATGKWLVLKSTTDYSQIINISWGGAGYDPVPADYDGDNRTDLAIVQRSTGNWYVLKSSTSFASSFTVSGWSASSDTLVSGAIVPGGRSDTTRASDFDGDGRSDMIDYYSPTGIWYTLTSSSNYVTTMNRSWGASSYTPAPGDYDGDGKTDYGLYLASTGAWTVLLSSTGYAATLSKNAGGVGWGNVQADYDGDGKTDIAVYNNTTGLWYVLKSSTNFTTTMSISWGGAGYTAVPGDFDGDGKADLGLYFSATGAWTVLLSSSNYTTTMTRNVGGSGYRPVPADFDGDGKTDFAVYGIATGLWYGLKSSTGYSTVLSVSWGGSGYVPIRGDFDGDGKADLAIYQTSTGVWSVLLSGTNYATSLSRSWGGTGYLPVPQYP